jgi:hypothetical protein
VKPRRRRPARMLLRSRKRRCKPPGCCCCSQKIIGKNKKRGREKRGRALRRPSTLEALLPCPQGRNGRKLRENEGRLRENGRKLRGNDNNSNSLNEKKSEHKKKKALNEKSQRAQKKKKKTTPVFLHLCCVCPMERKNEGKRWGNGERSHADYCVAFLFFSLSFLPYGKGRGLKRKERIGTLGNARLATMADFFSSGRSIILAETGDVMALLWGGKCLRNRVRGWRSGGGGEEVGEGSWWYGRILIF